MEDYFDFTDDKYLCDLEYHYGLEEMIYLLKIDSADGKQYYIGNKQIQSDYENYSLQKYKDTEFWIYGCNPGFKILHTYKNYGNLYKCNQATYNQIKRDYIKSVGTTLNIQNLPDDASFNNLVGKRINKVKKLYSNVLNSEDIYMLSWALKESFKDDSIEICKSLFDSRLCLFEQIWNKYGNDKELTIIPAAAVIFKYLIPYLYYEQRNNNDYWLSPDNVIDKLEKFGNTLSKPISELNADVCKLFFMCIYKTPNEEKINKFREGYIKFINRVETHIQNKNNLIL